MLHADSLLHATQDHRSSLPVAYCSKAEDMFAALGDATDAAIWNRALPADVQAWFNALSPERFPHGRYVLSPDAVAKCIVQVFQAQQIDTCAALAWFSEDVQALAEAVSQHSGISQVRLRVEPVFNNACTKFHIDNVFSRLICTYYGPGTEFGIGETEIASRGRAPTGMPVLLKGRRWPESTATRLHHRSPEIEGTGQSRFMVVLEGCPDADILPSYDHLYDCETIIR
ncbi:MAG: DUF1826 domain-containing protein [Pseudomonadota bacterium]